MKFSDNLTYSLKIWLFAACWVSASLCMGWGQKGHDVTAEIARRHLTAATADSVNAILDGHSLVYYANWADNACHTPQYAYTKTWHYKNIDQDIDYAKAPLNPDGDVVRAISAMRDSLASHSLNADSKWLALVLLTHFAGDIHQPMHMGRATDRGGNHHKLKFFNRETNLHSLWDSSVLESGHKWSYTEWADNIDFPLGCGCQNTACASGDYPDEWGEQTHGLAVEIYNATPEGAELEYAYTSQWTPTIEMQLNRAGRRLAHMLNLIFDAEYAALNPCCSNE